MTKLAATKANQIVADIHGNNAGFAGPGSVGDSDATTLTPNTRDADGSITGRTRFKSLDDTEVTNGQSAANAHKTSRDSSGTPDLGWNF